MADRRYWYEVTLNGSSTLYTTTGVQVQSSIESCTASVAQFNVWETPLIAKNDTIRIRQINLDTDEYIWQFKGRVNRLSAAHIPHQMTVICQGPLALLRRARLSSDRNLTGMTDGEAVIDLLTYAGVPFDPDDIQDAGLVLGAREDVLFKKGQSAATFIRSLDDALGMTTMECYDGRVVRLAYSLVPSDYASEYVTYQANGDDVVIYENQRDRGDLDAIRNVVEVNGASWECGPDDECNCTPWAKADEDNTDLGSGIRTEALTYSSEFIQDEAIAEQVAERLMRWNNRTPDTLRLVTANDPRVMPGRPVDVVDEAYGLALYTPTRYLVTNVDRVDDLMTLTLTGGSAGAVGTVTTGVEKVCNEASTDVDVPGTPAVPLVAIPPVTDFVECAGGCGSPPDPDDPPLLGPGPFVPESEWEIVSLTCSGDGASEWTEDWTIGAGTLDITTCSSGASLDMTGEVKMDIPAEGGVAHTRVRMWGHIVGTQDALGLLACQISIVPAIDCSMNASSSVVATASLEAGSQGCPSGDGFNAAYLYSWLESESTYETEHCIDPGYDFFLDFNPAAGTVTMIADGVTHGPLTYNPPIGSYILAVNVGAYDDDMCADWSLSDLQIQWGD